MAPPKRLAAKRAGIRGESRRNGAGWPKDDWRAERRGAQSHARHSAFISDRRNAAAPLRGLGRDAQAIEYQVKALDADRLHGRYHELVDKRLQGTLDFTELFELERVEARLDSQDQDEATRLTILQNDWRRERDELVASIKHLLVHFRAAS